MNDRNIAVGQRVKALVEGASKQLESMLEPVELPPEYSDAEVKQAILGISPGGLENLMQRLEQQGIPRQDVIHFLDEFSRERQW